MRTPTWQMSEGIIDLMNRGLQSWQADYDELQSRYDSLHVCYDEQIDARSRLQESHRTLYVENEQLRDLRDELQGANDDLAQRNAELSTEYLALRRKHRAIVNGVTELRSTTQPWHWTYSHLDHLLANEVSD